MDKKEFTKKKIDLFKSIMMNPKLSKTFKEAMVAPIGSTKREHAKSVLSIMKKLNGMKRDGTGGPISSNQQTNESISAPDYSNLMIFPAAPKFKTQVTSNFPSIKDGKGGTGNTTDYSNFHFELPTPTFHAPDQLYNLPINTEPKAFDISKYSSIPASINIANSTSAIPSNLAISSNNTNTVNTPSSGYSAPAGPAKTVPTASSQITGSSNPTIDNTQPNNTSTNGISSQYSNLSSGSALKNKAQKAVDEGTGAGFFALNASNEKFGGSLDEYINNLDQKLKTDFNLVPLEDELSKLKAEKGNLIPTLQTYMKGKDQYAQFIDKMIDEAEGRITTLDMGNPAVSSSYTNYLNYLYTLKGRQNTRYGNFLNAAVADYNADLQNVQSNYDNVYTQYNNAITRGATIAKDEYDNLYTAMSDLYNNLDQAPLKRLNLETAQLQNYQLKMQIIKDGVDQNNNTNPDSFKDLKTYKDTITDKDGNFDPSTLDNTGLTGFFADIAHNGGDASAGIKALNQSMSKAVDTAKSTGDISKVNDFKKLIDQLASDNPDDETAQAYAQALYANLGHASKPLVSDYVLSNLDTIKTATQQLVSGKSGIFSSQQAGLKDKASWKKNFSNLNSGMLDSLYNMVSSIVSQDPDYQKNPSSLISDLFKGSNNQEIADNVASSLVSW